MHMIITRMFKIPTMDSARDEMMIFMSGLREIILRGRMVRNSLSIERLTLILMSTTEVITIKKSSLDHELFR